MFMEEFSLYFNLGLEHIADLTAYDHILFILTLTAVYLLNQWKQILALVTAFTIGHTLTLALATLSIVNVSTDLIEFLIPVTIIITAITNIIVKKSTEVSIKLQIMKYTIALFFGLIHGLGFSNYLKSLLSTEDSLIKPLFAFNLGIEAGQLIIVGFVISLSIIFVKYIKTSQREWNLIISGAGLGISLIMALERIFW